MRVYLTPYNPIREHARAMFTHYYQLGSPELYEKLIVDVIESTLQQSGEVGEMGHVNLQRYFEAYDLSPPAEEIATQMLHTLDAFIRSYVSQWLFMEPENNNMTKVTVIRKGGTLQITASTMGKAVKAPTPDELKSKIRSDAMMVYRKAATVAQRQKLKKLVGIAVSLENELTVLDGLMYYKENGECVYERTSDIASQWETAKKVWNF